MTGESFLSITDLVKKLNRSSSWIYEQINEGKFPMPLPMSGPSLWSGLEVEAWMETVKSQPRSLRARPSLVKARSAKESRRAEKAAVSA